ncbi:uncharacterized protein LOC114273788 [Camellia sinensis]|uniref:uncharacterized protein LOC114273788 n=1 Tax=Camellia sinensis TaxID=4442 RepID=UPI00103648ED|nr:uncharacterized protein LOC114273788 [Camellia sinensis]
MDEMLTYCPLLSLIFATCRFSHAISYLINLCFGLSAWKYFDMFCNELIQGLQNREQEDRVHVLLKTKNATELVAPAIVAGLGALTHTLGTIVPMIGASGLAIAAAATTTAIGIVVSSFR